MKRSKIEKIGIAGMLLTAFLSPCCFPMFGVVLTAMGFGSFELFGSWTLYIFHLMVILSLIGSAFAFANNKKIIPLFLAFAGGVLIFNNYFLIENDTLLYCGMGSFAISGLLNFYYKRSNMNSNIQLKSIITCPHCSFEKEEIMAENACQFFYECENCKEVIKPKTGDCCVFCSYGTVKCPPIQKGEQCC